jgi:hypothetical protein
MNRFEVKYLVATRTVPALVEEFAEYTKPDPHDHGDGYKIASVYWDTADFRFFWEKIEGTKFRRKLRFRRYDDQPPVFVEVKQREDRTVQKRRLYRRRALFGAFDPELRLTFDGRIQYHHALLDIGRPFDTGRYALDPRASVFEVKYNHRAPRWLTKAVARHGFQMVRMSKYCNAVDRAYYGGLT